MKLERTLPVNLVFCFLFKKCDGSLSRYENITKMHKIFSNLKQRLTHANTNLPVLFPAEELAVRAPSTFSLAQWAVALSSSTSPLSTNNCKLTSLKLWLCNTSLYDTMCSNTDPSSEPPLLALFLLFPRLSFSCMRSCVPACSSCSCRLICGCCSKSSTDGRRVPWKQPTEPIGSWLAVFFVLVKWKVNERRLREASRWKCWVRPSSEREFARIDRCWSFASTLGCRWRWMVAPVTSSRTADTPATRYLTSRCMTCDWFVPNRIITTLKDLVELKL